MRKLKMICAQILIVLLMAVFVLGMPLETQAATNGY